MVLTHLFKKSSDLFHTLSFKSFIKPLLEGLRALLRVCVPYTQDLNKILKIGCLPSVSTETQRILGTVCLRLWDAEVRLMRDDPSLS